MNQLPHELANEIVMSTSYKLHLVVEGDSDYAVFKQHINPPKRINILPAHGSDNVLNCMAAVEQAIQKSTPLSRAKVHYFIDRDYRIATNSHSETADLTMTELKDLECEMYSCEAAREAVVEVICDKKLEAAKITIDDFIARLFKCASILGAVRYGSEKSKLNGGPALNFQDLNASKFFDAKSLTIDLKKLSTHLAGKNQGTAITEKTITDLLDAASAEKTLQGPLNLSSGHDISLLFSAAAKSHWKPKNYPNALEIESIEVLVRSFFKAYIRSFRFYKRIHNWIFVNSGSKDILLAP